MSAAQDRPAEGTSSTLESKCRAYQKKLLDTNKRNHAVRLGRIHKTRSFDLSKLDRIRQGTADQTSAKIIKHMARPVRRIGILPDSATEDYAMARRAELLTLSRNMEQLQQERGIQACYLGFPFLYGASKTRDMYYRAPLVLFPVRLERNRSARGGGWELSPDGDRPMVNHALLLALSQYENKDLPDYEDELQKELDVLVDRIESGDAEDLNEEFFNLASRWFDRIFPIVRAKGIGHSAPTESVSKEGFSGLEADFHLVNHKVVGSFPQADNAIYEDYTRLLDKGDLSGMIGDLLDAEDGPEDLTEDGQTGNEGVASIGDRDVFRLNCVLPSDPSQDRAMLESRRSRMVVLRGPPGTGKSQFITNMVSNSLASGERVLVVCQKRAALEVVKQRMSSGELDLGKYAAFVANESDRSSLYLQMSELIESVQGREGHDLDLLSSALEDAAQYPIKFSEMMEARCEGASLADLYSAHRNGLPTLDVSGLTDGIDYGSLDERLRQLERVIGSFKKLDHTSHPWRHRVNFHDLDRTAKDEIRSHISGIADLLPMSCLAPTKGRQKELVNLANKHKKRPGLLKGGPRKGIAKLLDRDEVTDAFIERNLEGMSHGERLWTSLEELQKFVAEDAREDLSRDIRGAGGSDMLLRMGASLDSDFDDMQELDKRKKDYGPALFGMLQRAAENLPPGSDWIDAIRRGFYKHWADNLHKNPDLRGRPTKEYQESLDRIAELMGKKHRAVAENIIRDIEAAISKNKRSGGREWAAFAGELRKKRAAMPLRALVEKYRGLVFQLAPCWLASPEMVSSIFPLEKGMFDLVIVDEASQLAVERTLPFLHRSKRAVIVGDEKQMPPSDLFRTVSREDEDDAEDDKIASLLIKSRRSLASKEMSLTWHYRSKHQELINFSNRAFYGGRLTVAPNVDRHPHEPPIEWVRCEDGVWDKNNDWNEGESRAVVARLREIWSKGGKAPTVGIITFNRQQAEKISLDIDKALERDPEFAELYDRHGRNAEMKEHEKLFVKNIETVQGDERDLIIFSIGYADGADTKLKNVFGSLSKVGGEKRFNVAITRAKEKMVVISSILPQKIKLDSKNEGPRMFGRFLSYAKSVSEGDAEGAEGVLSELGAAVAAPRRARQASDFVAGLQDALSKRGYEVDQQSEGPGYRLDLMVAHPYAPERYVLGIECDGPKFHSIKSVSERDLSTKKYLELYKWNVERVWGTDWYRDWERELDRIETRIRDIMATEQASAPGGGGRRRLRLASCGMRARPRFKRRGYAVLRL